MMGLKNPLVLLALLAAAGCGEYDDAPAQYGTRSFQIRPTDGKGWYGNGYGNVTVKHWDTPSGYFRIHYTQEGKHAVPTADANTDKTPDFVEQFGKTFDEVYKAEVTTLGFRPPLSDAKYHDRADYGGDGRFDVYLQDQAGSADGYAVKEACTSGSPKQCAGYMVVENDFVGYSYATPQDGMRVLASHEFFHVVQDAYRTGLPGTFTEATATWVTEQVYPKQDDFERAIKYFFKTPNRSLDHALGGPSDSFPYGLGIWPQFLTEMYGAKMIPAVMDELSEKGSSSNDLVAIDAVLARDHKASLSAAFARFALWNYFTGGRAGSYSAGYKKADDYPQVPVTVDKRKLPLRIAGEIAYLSTRYYQVSVPKGRWVQVTVERTAPKLAVHLLTRQGTKPHKVSSIDATKTKVKIQSGGQVVIVAASTARTDRHIPLSLAVTETSGSVTPKPDAGVPDSGGDSPKDEEESGCSVSGPAGMLSLLLLLAWVGRLAHGQRKRTDAPRALLLPLALTLGLGLSACSDDAGVDAGVDATPADAGVETATDVTITPDAPTVLAVGRFSDFEADKSGVIKAGTPVNGGEQYIALLYSNDTMALKVHKYTTTLLSTKSGPLPDHAHPSPEGRAARQCTFASRLRAILDSKPPTLWKPAQHQYATTPPKKGDKRSFKIRANNATVTIQAEAMYVDGTAVFWLDRTTKPLATIKDTTLKALADGFVKTIVPRERIYFGKESDLDSDGLIAILLSPLVTDSAVAYFSPCDLLDPTVVTYCTHSNKMEMLYMSPPSSLKPPYNTPNALLETVAHEFQHAIYFNRKYLLNNNTTAKENPYITEGLSHLAQDLSGYQAGNLYVLMASLKGVDLLSVPNLASDAITSYVPGQSDGIMRGGGYLVLRYMFDRAGGDAMDSTGKATDKGGITWLRKFMDAKTTGTANFTASSGLALDKLGLQFWTAMAVSNRGSGGKPINSNAKLNFLPTTVDPITQRQRGCNLFAPFHGFSLVGPATQEFSTADGKLRAGGGELLTLKAPAAAGQLSFQVTTTAEAKAMVRLIRVK